MGISHQSQSVGAGVTNLTRDDMAVFADATAGNVTINLPAANAWGANKTGQLELRRVDASVNTVTVQRIGADTVDGAVSIALGANAGRTLVSDGVSKWWSY